MHRFRPGLFLSALLCAVSFAAASACAQSSAAPVQIDISGLLNDRVVVTAQGGQLQPAQHGLDSTANSALITHSAAAVAGNLTGLPDNGQFSGNDRHPTIQLRYARSDGGPQVHRAISRNESIRVEVPGHRYRRLQLFLISSHGTTPLEVHMIYEDGTNGKRNTIAPEFHSAAPSDDPRWFVLASGLSAVALDGKAAGSGSGNLFGFDLNPDPTKKLVRVEMVRQDTGSVLTFFGAAGLVADSGRSSSSSHRRRR